MTKFQGWSLATLITLAFIMIQSSTINYGTLINNLPYFLDAPVAAETLDSTSLTRNRVVGASSELENIDRWVMRYKLYSIEADEIVSIMALARMDPSNLQLDPHFYQYGGSWLYPLGLWYFTLQKIGVVSIGSLDALLLTPDKIDNIYVAGRAFVLLTVSLSGIILFGTFIQFAPIRVALVLLLFYFSCPAVVAYSQIMKPHWYALLWSNLTLFMIVRTYLSGRSSIYSELTIGATLGFAVGASIAFALFAIWVWCALLCLVFRGKTSNRCLLIVPLTAVFFFILTNPYLFINHLASTAELEAIEGWYSLNFNLEVLVLFIKNSLVTGFGLGFWTLILTTLFFGRTKLMQKEIMLYLAAFSLTILIVSTLTAPLSDWYTNYRYATYLLPTMLLFIAIFWKHLKLKFMLPLLILNILQTTPLKIAYADENDVNKSTRLVAARWINKNIPTGNSVCINTPSPAPYDVAPFNFFSYKINEKKCTYFTRIERHGQGHIISADWDRLITFRPRFQYDAFPMVFEHINTQISVYKRSQ
jgi:hypothetical protein